MGLAYSEQGSDGRFYIRPLAAQLNGISFSTARDADYVCCAVNAAYELGKEEVRAGLRELIGAAEKTDGND